MRRDTLLLVYDAVEGKDSMGLEVASSPTGLRVPDGALLDAMESWYENRFSERERSARRLGELVLSHTGLAPAAVILMYVNRDRSFDRAPTYIRKNPPFRSFVKGTRLSPKGITEVEQLLRN